MLDITKINRTAQTRNFYSQCSCYPKFKFCCKTVKDRVLTDIILERSEIIAKMGSFLCVDELRGRKFPPELGDSRNQQMSLNPHQWLWGSWPNYHYGYYEGNNHAIQKTQKDVLQEITDNNRESYKVRLNNRVVFFQHVRWKRADVSYGYF